MKFFILLASILCLGAGQKCRPMTKKTSALDIAIAYPQSLVVQVKIKSLVTREDGLYDAVAQVTKTFKTRGLKKKSKITIGPVGKGQDCVEVKKKKKFFVFIVSREGAGANTYDLLYNPHRKPKDIKRVKKEVLCGKKCILSVPKLKKNPKPYLPLLQWKNETLMIMCKVKSAKPTPKFLWFMNDVMITNKNEGVDIASDKSKSVLQIETGPFLKSAQYHCVAKNGLGNATQTTRVIYAEICQYQCAVGPGQDGQYCLNGGLCCLDENTTSQFCRCPPDHAGNRCEKRLLNSPKVGGTSSMQKANATAILGMAAALLLVALLIVLTYFLSDRKGKRGAQSGRKQHYSIDNDNPDHASSQRFTNITEGDGNKITTPKPSKEVTPQLGGQRSMDILNEIASSPRPSITSMNGNLKRQRLNATAKGSASQKPLTPSSPNYDNVTTESFLSNGSTVSHYGVKREHYEVSSTSSTSSSRHRLHDSDELVFSPQPQPALKCKNAAVVSCRSRGGKPPGLTAPLLRQCEIDDGDDVMTSDDEEHHHINQYNDNDVTGESTRCISV